jgi:hypothetical protein
MIGFQLWAVMTMFSSYAKVEYRASFGPFEFEGTSAQVVPLLPPLLLLGFSVGSLLIEARRKISNQHSCEIESA